MKSSHMQARRSLRGVSTTIAALQRAILSVLLPTPRLIPLRVRTRRGAGMLEYALIALISIGVFVALNEFFPDFFEGILEGIEEQFDDTTE